MDIERLPEGRPAAKGFARLAFVSFLFIGILFDGFRVIHRRRVISRGAPAAAKITGVYAGGRGGHWITFDYPGSGGLTHHGSADIPWQSFDKVRVGQSVGVHYIPGRERDGAGYWQGAALDDDLGLAFWCFCYTTAYLGVLALVSGVRAKAARGERERS